MKSKYKLSISGILVGFSISLIIAFWQWKENKMPIPASFQEYLSTCENPENWDWFHSWRQGQIQRIFKRETRVLNLTGTRWVSETSGGILDFGDEGKFRWVTKPSTKSAVSPPPINQLIVDLIDGAAFEFDPNSEGIYTFSSDEGGHMGDGNLTIHSDPEVSAWIGFDGKTLGIHFRGPDSATPLGSPSPFGPVFTNEMTIYLKKQR